MHSFRAASGFIGRQPLPLPLPALHGAAPMPPPPGDFHHLDSRFPQLPLPPLPLPPLTPSTSLLPFPPQPPLPPSDGLVETLLEGQVILAFDIGGEKRLCLPQVLHRVLLSAGLSLDEIGQACDRLRVLCQRCDRRQMAALLGRRVFGPGLENCGLITQSDAERLCKTLLCGRVPRLSRPLTETGDDDVIKVRHRCFGKQRGLLMPRLYTGPGAPCIACAACRGLYSPAQFVGHSHDHAEVATCHWGFESARWRRYLTLDHRRRGDRDADVEDDAVERERLEAALESVKARFPEESAPDHPVEESWNSTTHPPAVKRPRLSVNDCNGCALCRTGPGHRYQPSQRQRKHRRPRQQSQLSQPQSSEFAPNLRILHSQQEATAAAVAELLHAKEAQAAESTAEAVLTSDWEALTDWAEGHLPEKATPTFLAMVDKVKSGYAARIGGLRGLISAMQVQILTLQQQHLQHQQHQHQQQQHRRLLGKYSAKREETRALAAECRRLKSALAGAALVADNVAPPSSSRNSHGSSASTSIVDFLQNIAG